MRVEQLHLGLLFAWSVLGQGVRRYHLNLTYEWDKQDGHGRPTFLINNDTPGPLLTVNEDETLEVVVENQMPIETTIHWHGIYQINEPWNDGVPGVTQWTTAPRGTYTYRMTPTGQYGSYFYHGHFGPAFSDVGSLDAKGLPKVRTMNWRPRPYSLISKNEQDVKAMRAAEKNPRHIIIADWNDQPMDMYLIRFRDTGYIPVCANSLTLNGRGGTKCESARDIEEAGGGLARNGRGCEYRIPGHQYTNPEYCVETHPELEVVQAAPGEEWLYINFINSGAHHALAISIDEHEFWVVGSDGEFVHSQKVVRTHINLGERTRWVTLLQHYTPNTMGQVDPLADYCYSILVHLNKPAGDYAIRLHSLRFEQVIQGAGVLRYPTTKDLSTTFNRTVPSTRPWLHLNGSVVNPVSKVMDESKLAPFPPRPPPPKADFSLKFLVNKTGPSTWVLNAAPHEFFRQNVPPILWNKGSRGKTSWGDSHGFLRNGSVVDLIIENGADVDSNHPGRGFPWENVDEALEKGGDQVARYFNLEDPPYRDGFTLYAGEGKFVVIRYHITFPAVSMLHCHMIHHFASGQQVILLEGMEVMPPVPQEMKDMPHVEFDMPARYGPLD
ncbi:multicopper oxidase-domain-containing protein [Apiospora saccharicola]|uniref:Multicopper oxidase-domain-containing protein n=1 Tax=Apiospora saccharicola TaxID=335842 RepID=A0ABR1UQ55_9PEZI